MKGSVISPSIDSISPETNQLCGQQVDALLKKAAGLCAPVSLFEVAQPHWPWLSGTIVKTNSQTIELALEVGHKSNCGPDGMITLLAKLYCDQHIYQFETQLIHGPATSTTAYLTCPEAIEVCERRRVPRRALRQPSLVQIRPSSQVSPYQTGTMLNVSSAGLACLLSTDDASTLQPSTQVRVIFSLEDTNNEFQLAGRVVNRSEAGTLGQCIVGIEFDDPADEPTKAKIMRDINAGRSA